MNFDLAIVGAGTTGCAIARHLARFDLRIALIDAAEDVAAGASRANSAIVHAGFDAKPGTLMARLNVRGNAIFEDWCRDLSIPFNRCGSLVAAFSPDDETTLRDLLARGEKNDVPDLRLVSGDEARALEPRLSKEAVAALWAPTAAIACPYEFCIACAENARANGAVWKLGASVRAMRDRENAVEFLVDSHELHLRGNGNLGRAAKSLTSDAERAASSVVNDVKVSVFNEENVLVAQRDISHINEAHEVVIVLEFIIDGAGDNGFDEAKELRALAVTNSLDIKGGLTVVDLDERFSERLIGIREGILLDGTPAIVYRKLNNVRHVRHYFLPPSD